MMAEMPTSRASRAQMRRSTSGVPHIEVEQDAVRLALVVGTVPGGMTDWLLAVIMFLCSPKGGMTVG